jgi:Domain of unknown function (DUF4349)
MKIHRVAFATLISSLLLSACSPMAAPPPPGTTGRIEPGSSMPSAAPMPPTFERGGAASMPAEAAVPAAPAQPAAGSDTAQQQTPGQPRLIIRTGNLSLVVDDVPKRMSEIANLATTNGGFVVNAGTNSFDQFVRGNTTIRVDATKFDATLAALRAMAIEVRAENSSGEDVTAEFVDLDAQLKNLESAEAQLQKILEGAVKTEDVLATFQQLTQIRGQIDGIKGRMKYLSQSAALSTVNIELIPDAAAQPVEPPVWRPGSTVRDAFDTLLRGLRNLADALIFITIGILPIIVLAALPIAGLLWLIRRISRAVRRNTSADAPPPPAISGDAK